MDNQQPVKLELNLEQVNQILEGLGAMPYTKVAPLIDAIRGQAIPQLQPTTENTEVVKDSK